MKSRLPYILLVSIFLLIQKEGFSQFKLFSKKKGHKTESFDNGTKKQKLQFAYGEAIRYKLIGDLDKALAYFLECVTIEPELAAGYFEISNIYHQYNELELALENAVKAAELDQDNFWYQVLHYESLEKLNRNKEALKVAEKLMEKYSEDEQLNMKVIYLYFINGEYKKGIALIDEHENKYGPSVDLLQSKKSAYLRMGNKEEALKEIKKLIELQPDEINHYLDLSDLLKMMNRKEEALEVFEALKKENPKETSINLVLAKYYTDERDYENAFKELVPLFEDESVSIDLKIEILLSYLEVVNKFPEFKEAANKLNVILIDKHKNNAKAHTIYGDFLYNDRKLAKAKYHFYEAVKLDSSRFAIWNQLIVIEAEQERYDSVLILCDRVKELFPNQPSLYYYSGIAHTQLDNVASAIKDYERGRMLVIDNKILELQFFLGLGDAYNELKQYSKSDEAFSRALKIDPNNSLALNNFAYYLSLRGERLEKALEMSKKSNTLTPGQSSYLDTYAWILYQLKKYEDAKEWIEKALKNGGSSSGEVLEHAGDIYFQLNDTSQAMEYWKKAKSLPGSSELLEKKIENQKLYEQ